jgi:hypothetical protein
VNLTTHTLRLPDRVIRPEPFPARCRERIAPAGIHAGVDLVYREFSGVVGLPDPQEGVVYVVSSAVRLSCPERGDEVSPGKPVYDDTGHIVGIVNLVANRPH